MNRNRISANDPFETLVELTAAAISHRPPSEDVYEAAGLPLGERVIGFLDKLLLHRYEAANDGDAALRRYFY